MTHPGPREREPEAIKNSETGTYYIRQDMYANASKHRDSAETSNHELRSMAERYRKALEAIAEKDWVWGYTTDEPPCRVKIYGECGKITRKALDGGGDE